MFKLFSILISLISLFSVVNVHAESEFNYQLLKDRRKTIKLPVYDIETKKMLIGQARLVLGELYVHREMKLKQFGKKIDPLPKLDSLEKSLNQINDEEFHKQMSDIFYLQRDLHTIYYLPMPYGCYRNLMPFSINEINKGIGSKLVVSSLIDIPEFLQLLPHKLDIEVGDELISYDGKSLRRLLKDMEATIGGANGEALRRLFLDELSFQVQTVRLMPKNDEVKVVFKKKNGKMYSASIPWINRGRNSCIKTHTQNSGRSEILKEFNQLFVTENEVETTEEPIVTWKKIKNEHGHFGVLYFSSFEPEKLIISKIVTLVDSLLKNELSQTDGLIIDLRNNPGGQIPLGERLIQLFGPKNNNEPLDFVFNVNQTNGDFLSYIFNEQEIFDSFNEAVRLGKKYSLPLNITERRIMNKLDQAYTKPVIVFNNALCYSTCDMFSAQMQDHGYALIAGEDTTTGAGGANVLYHSMVFEFSGLDSYEPFKKLPDQIDFGFAWRQAIRRNGKLIENVGVKADIFIPTTLNDVQNNSADQYLKLSKILKHLSL